MRRALCVFAIGLLAACSTPPTATGAGSEVDGIGGRLANRSQAPTTRAGGTTAGQTWRSDRSGSGAGRSGTVVNQVMSVQLDSGPMSVQCVVIEPGSIPSVPQHYRNDCAQAAIATVTTYFGVGGADPYQTVAQAMAPMAWGTRLEDVVTYLGGIDSVSCTPRPRSTLATLKSLTALGKPVPVVISLGDTQMHYLVVIGTGVSPLGQDLVIFRDPSRLRATDMGVLDAETFDRVWANQPIRSSWLNWIAQTFSGTNPANYDHLALDVGTR